MSRRRLVGTPPDQPYGVPLDVSVDHAPATSRLTFTDLGLPHSVVKALARAKITVPTPVQAAVVPDALAGRDILGRAATGSGKTLAFGLPLLTRLAGSRSRPKAPRALIIVPTRELAGQVRGSLEPMADAAGLRVASVYGGTPYDRQIKRLRAGVDLVVATPGRLDDLVRRGACRLDSVEITVLDEADHLCDLGFFPAVDELVAMTPAGGQRMLLSATLDGDVDKLVRRHLSDPVTHDCESDDDVLDVAHHVLVTSWPEKLETTAALLRANPRSIVFTRTRHGATNLARDLASLGVSTVDLHGSLSQSARERNLRTFRSGQADVVVATDVAARGIHVDNVRLVVHYDAPTERKAYLHRSGRTARAGQSGTVVTMTTPQQAHTVARVQKAAGVRALHHDARTTPHPMTAESLAGLGVEAPRIEGGAGRPQRQRATGQQRAVGARVGAGGSRDGRRAHHGRPSTEGRRGGLVDGGSRRRRQDRTPRSETDTDTRPPTVSGARKPRAGKVKKARWTAAERRARSKR